MFPPDPARPTATIPFDAHRSVASDSTLSARVRWGEVSCHGAKCPISYVCRTIVRLLDSLYRLSATAFRSVLRDCPPRLEWSPPLLPPVSWQRG